MIELLFNESAAGSLKFAKSRGQSAAIGVIGSIGTIGEVLDLRNRLNAERERGPLMEGSPADIAPLWIMADIGDISDLGAADGWGSRLNLWREIGQMHEGLQRDGDWPQQQLDLVRRQAGRLARAARTGEPVRIWWSDSPSEACGFYWAMALLKDAEGPVSGVKVPLLLPLKDGYQAFTGTGELEPRRLVQSLAHERRIERDERLAFASLWQDLVRENAPLRAMLNGHLHSVPEDFYDYALRQAIPSEPCAVTRIIGNALIHGPGGVADWWYAKRIQALIERGELSLVRKDPDFYSCVLCV